MTGERIGTPALDWPISRQQVGPRAMKVLDVLESFRPS